jgi:hypothetical protein
LDPGYPNTSEIPIALRILLQSSMCILKAQSEKNQVTEVQ